MHSRNLRFLHDQQRAVLLCAALPPPLEYRLTMNEVFDERGRPQLERLRAHLASEGLLTEEAALRIVHEGAALLRSEPTVLEVEAPITGMQCLRTRSSCRPAYVPLLPPLLHHLSLGDGRWAPANAGARATCAAPDRSAVSPLCLFSLKSFLPSPSPSCRYLSLSLPRHAPTSAPLINLLVAAHLDDCTNER